MRHNRVRSCPAISAVIPSGRSGAAGVRPDADVMLRLWDRMAYVRYHRGVTHSLAGIVLVALVGGWLTRRVTGRGRSRGSSRWGRG